MYVSSSCIAGISSKDTPSTATGKNQLQAGGVSRSWGDAGDASGVEMKKDAEEQRAEEKELVEEVLVVVEKKEAEEEEEDDVLSLTDGQYIFIYMHTYILIDCRR